MVSKDKNANKSKPKLIKSIEMDSTQNKTPSIKQQEQFIEFVKQNDPEVIDYAEDLLHGIYPQRTITEEQLDQFIKEGKKKKSTIYGKGGWKIPVKKVKNILKIRRR